MRTLSVLIAVALLPLATYAQQAAETAAPAPTPEQIKAAAVMPFRDASLPIEKRVDDLVRRLTLEEKVSQLIDRAPAIPRLDIPAYNWWNEGLHGVARSGFATLFPQAIGNAATWDAPLVHSIGGVVSTEARSKYNDAIAHNNHDRYFGLTIWSPNINIFRDPRWGRGQETYGEDPFLTAHLGTAFVEGIQGDDPKYFRAIATPKHYAVHSGPESTRHKANVDPSPHDLWDTYLPAFRATIVDSKADSIMCAYNRVDKVPACANKMLLGDILRGDWHFNGFVTSDCGAIGDFYESYGHHYSPDAPAGSAAGVLAGTDTDCGTEYRALTDAVHKGLVSEPQIDVSLKRLFTARMKLGMFDPPEQVPFSKMPMTLVNSPEHAALALRASRESMVLLKNEGHFLPIDPAKHQTIAVVGPLAGSRVALEGNYNAIPLHPILPIDGIESEFGHDHVLYAQGATYIANGDLPVPRTMLRAATDSTVDGLEGQYFSKPSFDGAPAMVRIDKEIDFDWAFANPVEPSDTSNQSFAVRWVGALRAPVADTLNLQFRLPICYPCQDKLKFAVYLDGKKLEPAAPPTPTATKLPPSGRNYGAVQHFAVPFADTRPHELRIEYIQSGRITGAGLSFEWTPSPELLQKQAVEAASNAEAVIAFVGLTPRLEGEEMKVDAKGFSGGDRTDIELPDVQKQMLEAVARAGKPITVVLLNGSALAMNWAQQNARALIEAWYPGQSGGQAIAETLSGKNNPAGRLPVTFYTGVDQLPAFEDYSMANRTYRYFKGKPLYAFGDGLSYATFAYSGLKLSTTSLKAGNTLTVEADVKNTGSLAGDEVAELYLIPPQAALSAKQALSGFQRLHLNPGETKHVSFKLDPRTLSQVDEKGVRAVIAGEYKLSVGGSQPDGDLGPATMSTTFTISGGQQLPH
ncbi:glycoside hydrolase family 3 C-terminal domain-containing protein [Occallatibacter savannae]|uniref:glycoside hydrolase family 3 C-terminal domain-containing protein n=1 Tax=Occallatibacter savannae TaxID=1002691 RepID=UPI000D69EAE1|nr:glycoside hydrolase family 3 C-terminal domain-containing protein [Occallatibacter savannae]